MIWHLRARSYHSAPYRIEPGVRGWQLWIDLPQSLKSLGRDLKSLQAAKALAALHAKGDARVPA